MSPQRLDLPVREAAPSQQSPTRNKSVDTIRSSTIDQQKEKLENYLSGADVKRQSSKASFLVPKREKSVGNCSPVTKKLGDTTVVSLSTLVSISLLRNINKDTRSHNAIVEKVLLYWGV